MGRAGPAPGRGPPAARPRCVLHRRHHVGERNCSVADRRRCSRAGLVAVLSSDGSAGPGRRRQHSEHNTAEGVHPTSPARLGPPCRDQQLRLPQWSHYDGGGVVGHVAGGGLPVQWQRTAEVSGCPACVAHDRAGCCQSHLLGSALALRRHRRRRCGQCPPARCQFLAEVPASEQRLRLRHTQAVEGHFGGRRLSRAGAAWNGRSPPARRRASQPG